MAKVFILNQEAELEEFFIIYNNKFSETDHLFSVEHKLLWSESMLRDLKSRHAGTDVFSITKPFTTDPHWHMDAEQRLILSGKGHFFVPTKTKFIVVEAEPGDLIWLSPALQHWFDTDSITAVRFFEHEKKHVEQKNNLTADIEKMYSILKHGFRPKIQ